MPSDWIPFAFTRVGKRTMVQWVHAGSEVRLREPFFKQSIKAMVDAHAPQKLTPLSALTELSMSPPPAGFIFHVSRCGSTLVSRSLAAVASTRIVSEPGCVNQLLLDKELQPHERAALLKGLIGALSASDPGTASIFKFTSWNLLFLEQILAQYPTTPWLFIFREPRAVMRSLIAQPPGWASNPALAGRPASGAGTGWETTLPMLEQFFAAPLAHFNQHALAINYTQLPGAIAELARHFGLALTPHDLEQILHQGQFDAKQAGAVPYAAPVRATLPEQLTETMTPVLQLYQQWEASQTLPAFGSEHA